MKYVPFFALAALAAMVPCGMAQEAPASQPQDAARGYTEFVQVLEAMPRDAYPDYCPALLNALKATGGDEFAVLDWMRKAADEGCAPAQFYMASQRLGAQGVSAGDPGVSEAVALLKAASDQGYAPAMSNYGVILVQGLLAPKDEAAGNEMIDKACAAGDFMLTYHRLDFRGNFLAPSPMEDPEIKAETDRGNPYVILRLSLEQNGEEQAAAVRRAAELGNGSALFTLSSMVRDQDRKASYKLLQEAVGHHSPSAIFVMARLLLAPGESVLPDVGITEDCATGMQLVKLAHLLGVKEAGELLADVYYGGLYGVPMDRSKAYRHFQYLNEHYKDMVATAVQGYMLLKGDGTAQDTEAGDALLRAADLAGACNAPVLLACAHYNGFGYPKDAAKAVNHLFCASYTPYAYIFLAYIYTKGGVNVEPDSAAAESYLDMAELDMGEKAREVFNMLIETGVWEAMP